MLINTILILSSTKTSILNKGNKMTPQKFKETLILLGLNQNALAKKLEISPQTVCKYASGAMKVTKAVELALEGLLQRKRDELNNHRNV